MCTVVAALNSFFPTEFVPAISCDEKLSIGGVWVEAASRWWKIWHSIQRQHGFHPGNDRYSQISAHFLQVCTEIQPWRKAFEEITLKASLLVLTRREKRQKHKSTWKNSLNWKPGWYLTFYAEEYFLSDVSLKKKRKKDVEIPFKHSLSPLFLLISHLARNHWKFHPFKELPVLERASCCPWQWDNL